MLSKKHGTWQREKIVICCFSGRVHKNFRQLRENCKKIFVSYSQAFGPTYSPWWKVGNENSGYNRVARGLRGLLGLLITHKKHGVKWQSTWFYFRRAWWPMNTRTPRSSVGLLIAKYPIFDGMLNVTSRERYNRKLDTIITTKERTSSYPSFRPFQTAEYWVKPFTIRSIADPVTASQ